MKHKPVKTYFRWRKRRIFLWIAAILFIFLIPAVVMSVYVFHHVGYMGVESEKYPLQDVYEPKDFSLNAVEHTIRTGDGEELWCSEVACDDPQGVILYLSDLREPSVTYFYGHAAWMQKKGFASFLLEVRAHGESTGHKLGLGCTEVEDVRSLVQYIKGMDEYRNLPVIVQGVGLGGTIALNSVGAIPEVDACIAMSPWAGADTQLTLLMKKYYVPGFIRNVEKPILHQALRILYGKKNADQNDPKIQIKNAGEKPVLVIASLRDPHVPVENSRILQDVAPDAEFWLRDSEDHYIVKDNDLVHVEQDQEYCTYVSGFLFKVIRQR